MRLSLKKRILLLKNHQELEQLFILRLMRSLQVQLLLLIKLKKRLNKGFSRLKVGVKNTVMLTGDHHKVAQDVASQLGIDSVYSELLPSDKVTQVEQLLSQKQGYVAFVGDGINDAPVLARADVGIVNGWCW
mgnify:CR=1 FL=1